MKLMNSMLLAVMMFAGSAFADCVVRHENGAYHLEDYNNVLTANTVSFEEVVEQFSTLLAADVCTTAEQRCQTSFSGGVYFVTQYDEYTDEEIKITDGVVSIAENIERFEQLKNVGLCSDQSPDRCSLRFENGAYHIHQSYNRITANAVSLDEMIEQYGNFVATEICEISNESCSVRFQNGLYSVIHEDEALTAGTVNMEENLLTLEKLRNSGICRR